VLLTVVLWAVGLAGIIGYVPFLEKERRDKWAIAAVGVLIGARISDGIFSHIRLWNLGYKPNPGLESIPYYFAEALFLIILEDYPTPLELARYKQEYEIVRNLHLDCAIAAYGLEKYQNTLAIVLEDFGGVSLNLLINNQKLTLKEFLKLAIKIAESLGAIHTANIIHKDINPSNIVFNPETGLLKIIDFGISTISPKTLWT
jgi:serine/threonine protein kinase